MSEFEWVEEYSKTKSCEVLGAINTILSVSKEDQFLRDYTNKWYEKNHGYTRDGYYDEYYHGYEIITKDIISVEVDCIENYDGSHISSTYINIHTGQEIPWEEVNKIRKNNE